MREPKVINHSDMKVIMRKDFYALFGEQLNKIAKDTGVRYFGHNIIKNYGRKGHKISTFCNYEDWHDIYWKKYFNNDLSERATHQAVQKYNFTAISWQIYKDSEPSCKERIKITQLKDGIVFSFKRSNNYLETFNIGWDNLNTKRFDVDCISHFTSLFKPMRDYHWEVHDKL